MRFFNLECEGVTYRENTPEFGQICIARTDKNTYIKGMYGGYLPYCKKYKILNSTEYTCPTMIKMSTPVQSVVWVKDDAFWTTNN
jgi:hypothetical protein